MLDKWKREILVFMTMALAFASITTHAIDAEKVVVDLKNASLQITLPANPTTGYQWQLKQHDNKLIELKNSQYITQSTKLIGAGGKMVFDFNILCGKLCPQKTTVLFEYARPWDPKSGTTTAVTVRF